jgi:Xaa-Pro aminopeptidase
MSELFTAEFFAGNRERLRQLFTGTAPIVVTANGLLQRGSDEAFPFHQDRSFWYLTGVEEPDVVLVMDKGKEYLIVPEREIVREAFDGAVDVDEMKRHSGIADIRGGRDGWHALESRLKKVKHVATMAANPRYSETWGMYTNPARAELNRKIKTANENIELLDLRQHLARMRMIKQPVEIKAIQQAIDITIDSMREVMQPKRRASYAYEYEVEADLTRGFRKRGASGHAFTPIVASGKRACTLHNVINNGALASDELLTLDVGADFAHYSADITRTIALGVTSRRQEAVHKAVEEAVDFAGSILKPGVLLHDYEKQMEQFVGEKLRELSVIKTITHENVRKFFPHATSHFLGLDTHDAGDYDRPLEADTVMTIEPGIYIPKEGIGVRIEEDVLITQEGIKNLTGRLSRQL